MGDAIQKQIFPIPYFPMQILFDTSGWNGWCKSNRAT